MKNSSTTDDRSPFGSMNKITVRPDKGGRKCAINLSGQIEPASAKQVADALHKLGNLDEIGITVNSLGGDWAAGMGIFDALATNRAWVSVEVSAASGPAAIVAMAGHSISMASNGYMKFPSDPISELFRGRVIEIMARRCNLPRWRAVDLLRSTGTWCTAQEALQENLIGRITPKANLVNFSGLDVEDGMPHALAKMVEKAVPHQPRLESLKERIAHMKYATLRQARSMRRN